MNFKGRFFMKMLRTLNFFLIIGSLGAFSAVAWLVGCGTTKSTNNSGGTVTTSLSDPPVCSTTSVPSGPFSAVWVTVTKVTANTDANAASGDSTSANSKCFLTQLGSKSGLPAGDYQQIRIYLLANDSSSGPSTNNCGTGNGWNCVVDNATGPHELTLPSEAQTGLKIPSGQIAGGKFTIAAGQSADLDIDFNACASIVKAGASGKFLLKPVLHAGEASVNNATIGGTVVDSATGSGIMGAMVLLEQPSTVTGVTEPVDQVVYATTTDASGNFFICPVQGTPGTTTYDVVIAAVQGGVAYNPDIVFSVPVGTTLGNLKLVSEGIGNAGGTLAGQITSAGASGAIAEDVTLQTFTKATPTGGTETEVTIPWLSTNTTQPAALPQNFMTQATANVVSPAVACPASTDCYNYEITLPASAAQVGTFSGGSANLPTPPTTPTNTINYDLLGTVPNATPGCTTSPAIVPTLAVTPATTTPVTVLAFTGCT
ncbi:MAG: hypothetical protein DMG21_17205 [Acidobacteria bacterium]|nr:MAG: hypothetical protein DMG21_17205 [Acidobacteriota bacterium]